MNLRIFRFLMHVQNLNKFKITMNLYNNKLNNNNNVSALIIIIEIMARNMNPSLLTFIGHIEGKVCAAVTPDCQKLVTMGQDDLIQLWNIDDMTSRQQIQISQQAQEVYTCFDYCQKNHVFALGAESGNVSIVQENNTSNSRLIYRGSSRINSLKFSSTFRHLAIATNQSKGVVYDQINCRFVRADEGHQGQVLYSAFLLNEKTIVTIGSDCYANFYTYNEGSINNMVMNSKFKICNVGSAKNMLNFSERPNHINHVSFGGSSTLQQVKFVGYDFVYSIQVDIRDQQQFRNVCWINQYILAVSTANKVILWNYLTKNKFHVFNELSLYPLLTDGLRLFGCNDSGIIHRYENISLFNFQSQQAKKYQYQLQNPTVQVPKEQMPVDEPEEDVKIEKKKKKKPQISKAAQLVIKSPQPGIESFYEMHLDNQFLFYNQHGCVIKRIDGDKYLIQLQFHDKHKLKRIKFEAKDKYFCFFALTEYCFMYSNHNHAYFEMETYNRVERNGQIQKQPMLLKWDYRMPQIQGVAIGNSWVAIAGKTQIRILDFCGNQLHCICIDRIYLAMAAYQNMLVIAYSASLPLIETHLFQVKFYTIGNQSYKLTRKTLLPIKNEEYLKWLGFSQEGCLFNQDSSQTIRMYCWDADQWVTVLQENKEKFKFYIQNIQNYQIYGFRIEQKENQPTGPTVLPRSLPRRILFEFSQRGLSFLSNQQNKKLESIYLMKLSLGHEKFRNRMWYKYKYSRGYDNQMFKYSQSIKSEEQIEQMATQIDIFIVDQIKKLLPILQNRITREQFEQAKFKLFCCCSSFAYYPQTIQKINKMLSMPNILKQFEDQPVSIFAQKPRKYSKLSRLSAMVDMGWIQRSKQEEVMNQ